MILTSCKCKILLKILKILSIFFHFKINEKLAPPFSASQNLKNFASLTLKLHQTFHSSSLTFQKFLFIAQHTKFPCAYEFLQQIETCYTFLTLKTKLKTKDQNLH